MNNDVEYDSILGVRHVVNLIFYLSDEGEINSRQLRKISTNYNTMINLCTKLSRLDIIDVEEIRSPRMKYVYRLTEKGKRLAKKLREAETIIGGENDTGSTGS